VSDDHQATCQRVDLTIFINVNGKTKGIKLSFD
jgi:hypothetical protein